MNKYDFGFSSRVRRLRTPPMNSNQILKKYQKMYLIKNFCTKLFLQMRSHYAFASSKCTEKCSLYQNSYKITVDFGKLLHNKPCFDDFFYILQRMQYIKINSLQTFIKLVQKNRSLNWRVNKQALIACMFEIPQHKLHQILSMYLIFFGLLDFDRIRPTTTI